MRDKMGVCPYCKKFMTDLPYHIPFHEKALKIKKRIKKQEAKKNGKC